MSAPTAVAWQPWSATTFAAARAQGKPILVNVAAAWCHWCHVMDERTFADPQVAGLLRDRFVCIRVDADARPDLAERYAEWGWPANAVLTPDAAPVLERRGFQEPDAFLGLLQDVADRQQAGALQGRIEPPPAKPSRRGLDKLRDLVQDRLDGYYDERIGGWGRFQKYPFAAPVEHAFLRAQRGEEGWLGRAVQTLDGTRSLIDTVWGGVFQYSVQDTWDDPHFEKIAVIQAGALDNFAQAYHVTREGRFLDDARDVHRYLAGFLRDPSGAFWTSQDADVQDGPTPTKGPDYYALDDRARRKRGLPRTDRNVYADWNGLLVQALVRLHAATLAAPGHAPSADVARLGHQALDDAKAAAATLLRTHRNKDGSFRHGADDASGIVHLRDNAAMGRGLLALHQATGDAKWLDAAVLAAKAVRKLEAKEGGFHAHSPDPAATGVFAQRRRPLEENGMAVRFLTELAWLGHDPTTSRASCEKAVRALAHDDLVRAEGRILGNFLLGIEWLLTAALQAKVVGQAWQPDAQALHAAAVALPQAPKLVLWTLAGDDHPDVGRPSVYLCAGSACASPVTEVAVLETAARRLLQPVVAVPPA